MRSKKERVTFHYNTETDADIHAWIESLPERGKSPVIQQAIRQFIQQQIDGPTQSVKGMQVDTEEMKAILTEVENLKARLELLEKKEGTSKKEELPVLDLEKMEIPEEITDTEEQETVKKTEPPKPEGKYVSAASFLQNLGK